MVNNWNRYQKRKSKKYKLTIKDAEKKKRRTYGDTDNEGYKSCKLNLPACFIGKYVRVICVNSSRFKIIEKQDFISKPKMLEIINKICQGEKISIDALKEELKQTIETTQKQKTSKAAKYVFKCLNT